MAKGYRWRDERAWEKLAIGVCYLLQSWGYKGTWKELIPKAEASNDEAFEQLAGMTTPGDSLDIMLARQAARKAKS